MPTREISKTKETTLVVGFNARPIAASAKRSGFRVLAVDYWGDTDLASSAEDVETVLKQLPGERPRRELTKPASELLVECAKTISERHRGEISFTLVGSGLDDRPDLWKRLGEIAPVLGNSTKTLEIVRNRLKLYEIASKLGLASPTTIVCSNLEETLDAGRRIGYPVVLKPQGGGGGVGIKLVSNETELGATYLNEWKTDFGDVAFLQEYIVGKNVSASIMGDGEKSAVVTVNEQLIGLTELGARTPFIWCGNIVPLEMSKNDGSVRRIASSAKALGDQLKLKGSSGFDFVLRERDMTPVLIECNPRFQGTLECVEMATGMSVVMEHVKACRGRMRTRLPQTRKYVTKIIPFAKSRCVTGDLHGILGVRDISPTGVILEQGDPICTVHRLGSTKQQSIQRARESVAQVYHRLTLN